MRKAGFAFGAMVVAVLALGTRAADEKVPEIKTIMQTVGGTKKEKGLCAKCAEAGKAEKWDDAQKYAKSLTDCCSNLPKHQAPKGDEKNWEKLTKAFAEQSKVIAKAAEDKNAEDLGKAVGTFTKACGTCHMSYKGKSK